MKQPDSTRTGCVTFTDLRPGPGKSLLSLHKAVKSLESQVQRLVSCYFSKVIHLQQLKIQQSIAQRFLRFKSKLFHSDKTNVKRLNVILTNVSREDCFTSVTTPPCSYLEKAEVSQMLKEYGPGEGAATRLLLPDRHPADDAGGAAHSPRTWISTGLILLSSVMPWTSEKTTAAPSGKPCFCSSVQITTPGFS